MQTEQPHQSETRPGTQTTEFWLAIASNLLTIVAMIAHALPPKYAVPTLSVVNGFYAIGRGLAKQGVKPE